MTQDSQFPRVTVAGLPEPDWWVQTGTPLAGPVTYSVALRRAKRAQVLAERARMRTAADFIGPANPFPQPTTTQHPGQR